MISPTRSNPRRAFTLLELLVVLAVIVILASLLFIAGRAVTGRQQSRATENVLLSLERILDVYMLERGSIPPYDPDKYIGTPGDNNGLATDPVIPGDHPSRPDAAVFLEQASGYGEVDSLIQSIPPQFIRLRRDRNIVYGVDAPSVVDAWAVPGWPDDPANPGEPFPVQYQQVIYFVHPKNAIAQALFGQCLNERPYFMSAGPDRTYGFVNEPANPIEEQGDISYQRELVRDAVSDNIYSTNVGPIDDSTALLGGARNWSPRP